MALDLLLNMNININQLLGYVLEKCGPEKTAEVYKTLKVLKNKPRIKNFQKSPCKRGE